MKDIFDLLFMGFELNEDQSHDAMLHITSGHLSDVEIASFLSVYNMRRVAVSEFRGFRRAMLEQAVAIDFSDYDTVDVLGTGGDGKNTFNISTACSFVVAGAGYKVVKHCNDGMSSVSASPNMFDYYGYRFTSEADLLRRDLETAGICFLHAPLFHPAMENVANVRRLMGVRTLFNYIGPVINPSKPRKQLIGCHSFEVMKLYNELLRKEEGSYVMVHAVDGYDEVSLTGNTIVGSDLSLEVLEPKAFGFDCVAASELSGGDSVEFAADVFLKILKNEATKSQIDVVLANAALAIRLYKPHAELLECVAEARESLESGRAYGVFKKLLSSDC
ncbi:MAG: anthranilate phosphoribosyltransferase [Mangrovibacterium sp.]